MEGHNFIAVYASRNEAERARDRLVEIGIPGPEIRISAAAPSTMADASDPAGATNAVGAVRPPHREGFWDWLFGRDLPARDRSWYASNLREGRTVLSVFVRDADEHHRVADILEEFDPIDFDEGEIEAAAPLGAGTVPSGSIGSAGAAGAGYSGAQRPLGTDASLRTDRSLGSPEAWSQRDRAGSVAEQHSAEQVIPVAREELSVGKRASEHRYRVRTYVVETPIEKEVTLHDERVIVEHRPVSGEAALNAQIPQEREFEVVERHEEPVVEKRARNIEEVVIRTDASERTETVRDTVRQTRVDVENEAGGRADNLERAIPEERKP